MKTARHRTICDDSVAFEPLKAVSYEWYITEFLILSAATDLPQDKKVCL